jgi:hypothetical protein
LQIADKLHHIFDLLFGHLVFEGRHSVSAVVDLVIDILVGFGQNVAIAHRRRNAPADVLALSLRAVTDNALRTIKRRFNPRTRLHRQPLRTLRTTGGKSKHSGGKTNDENF